MAKDNPRTNRFREHGRIDKKGDSYNGLNLMSPERQKAMAEIRVRAAKLNARIQKQGIS